MQINIREANQNDFLEVHKFVSTCKPLENYFEHFYKIMLRYFGNTCFIAEHENKIVGYLMGIKSQTHESTYFLWKIGVSPSMQGKGIGRLLLERAENKVRDIGLKRIEVTIDPENTPSKKLFESMGFNNISLKEGVTVKVNGNIAVKDYYRPGRHFMLYEKWLR
ncbi:GNAT family N-acetyltransferase [Candidatus Methanoperedens nitratireducens]|uniref:GCN5-related N-acetyltransferase n=1 Tax=Candidatus Methanoperedens nitratireducens TaxID=1392998 RepID=A0A284VLU0_9EURY|nr:GNAT family N-acetyltransferase [Candidatus Methanoperedens nitroreducens]SNQ60250.1 GCN5-related N-acetyltransferase [Candidatus Methanoperedens nitroreducens]